MHFLQLKILDKYIIKKFLSTFVFIILIFIAIFIVFDISENIDSLLGKNAPLNEIVFDYYFNFIPYFIVLISPLFVFITVIFFTSKMASKSEIIPILTSGVTYNRLLLPFLFSAALVAVLNFVLTGWFLAEANKQRVNFTNLYIRSEFYNGDRNIHFKDEKKNHIYYLESFSVVDSTGYHFSIEVMEKGKLVKKLFSDRIKWLPLERKWRIENYYVRSILKDNEKIEKGSSIDTILPFLPEEFGRPLHAEDISLLNNRELNDYIESEHRKGKKLVHLLVEKYNRFAAPFTMIILTLIGVALSSKKKRGGIGVNMTIGIVVCFSYIVMNKFTSIFAIQSDLSPILAAWIPNILFGIIALILLRFAQK